MKAAEKERQDWIVVLLILILGLVSVIAAGQLALRFSPGWTLNADMESHIDPNSAYLTERPGGPIAPLDPALLTPLGWMDLFLTPSASFVTGTPVPAFTRTPSPEPTLVPSRTATAIPSQTFTSTVVYVPLPTRTATPRPASTDTPSIVTPISTSTATAAAAASDTPTASGTPTSTSTATHTATPSNTPGPIPTDPVPPAIGTTPDGTVYLLPAGGSLTLGINLIANGDPGFDLVYYERPAPSGNGIFLDWMIVEISDGISWYTVFNWGNNAADTNTNMDFNILPNPQTPPESDQRDIPAASLYNGTGIAIDIDALVPPGTYSYIRFTAPTGDADNQTEIDAVEVLP